MLLQVCCLLSAGIVLQGSSPPPKSWIADLKAARATLGANEVRIEGDVVDIRSTSPAARAGFYRLIDASDPDGVLLRTDRLPRDGGALRVVARLSPRQLESGPLLFDELRQERLDRRPRAPLVLGGLSLLALVIVAVLLVRAAIAERRYKLSPPLWLLPEAGPYGKALAAVPGASSAMLKYSPELEEVDRIQRERLRRHKRSLFRALLGSAGLSGLSGAWLLLTEPASAQVPAFIFIEANDTPIPVAQPRADTAKPELSQALLDSLVLALRRPSPDPRAEKTPGQRESARPPAAETTGTVRPESLPPMAPITLPAFTPSPSPAPAPAPPPVRVEEPAPRDPEADRIAVSQILTQAAGRLVDAINSRRLDNVARLLPEGLAGDLGRRDRFMKLLKDYSPRATLGRIEGTAFADTAGEARFTIQFEWRGDFGVSFRKVGQFSGIVSRGRTDWRLEGARLLNAVP
jgi:hypothetical protein